MDGQRLHPHVRRAAPDRRRARRPLRPPAAVRDRARHLHRRLGRRRARTVDRGARRRACAAGPRRRDRHAADADAALARRCRPRSAALALGAWGGIGGLAVALGPLVGGAVVQGLSWQWIFWLNVPIGLVADPARAAPPRREPRPRRAGSTCPASRSRAPACSGSSGASSAATAQGWTSPEIVAALARRRRCSSSASSPGSCATADADAADALLPQPRVRRRQRGVAADVLRDVRLDLPARAVLPDRAGLLAVRLRAADPAVDGDADLHRPDRRRALRPDRRAAADGRSGWRCRRSASAGWRRSARRPTSVRATSSRRS